MADKQIFSLFASQQLCTRAFQVLPDPGAGHLAKGNQPLLVAFAKHTQHVFRQADVEYLERHQFTHAQSAGIHQFQHGAVAHAQCLRGVRRLQQGFDLRFGQGLGHAQCLSGSLQLERRIAGNDALAQGPAKVALENCQAPVRCCCLARLMLRRKVGIQIRL